MSRRNHSPDKAIVVASIPPPVAEQPYVGLFYQGMANHGVTLGPAGPYTPSWLVANREVVSAFHFHWLHLFYVAGSRARAVVRFAIFAARLAVIRTAGFRLFWTVHNIGSHEHANPWLDELAARLMARLADRILAHGPAATRAASAWLRRQDVVELPLFAYCGHYPDSIDRAAARARLGLPHDAFVLLALGKIRVYKGLDQLIRSFRDHATPADRLLVVGRPETPALGDELRALTGGDERILLELRFVPDDEVQLFHRAADVAVLPYRDILTSAGCATALAFGVPIVAPSIGSIPDHVGPDAGRLYAGEGLWAAIEEVRASDQAAMREAAAARGRELSFDRLARVAARAFREACGCASSS